MMYPFLKPVNLPSTYHVHDFENQCTHGGCHHTHSVGRYNENRDFYSNDEGRSIHLGIDFGAPAGTPVLSVSDCTVFYKRIFPEKGDYGPIIVTTNIVDDKTVYCLYAHLETASFNKIQEGQTILRGQEIARIGEPQENGGWPPHLHFQICTTQPSHGENIPGVVQADTLQESLALYPDPQKYFGPLY